MNDSYDANQAPPAQEPASGPESPRAGFCQNCGTPLTTETIRRVGPAVYCEPCLAARLGTPIPGASAGASGYGPVRAGVFTPGGAWATDNLNAPGPNPGLAALLGLIPGVGAMYNEQYAKGIIHLVVFAVLVSLTDNVNGIFLLFVFGWVFYMAIEAHHTARARRDGTPLPNPFGLNDIGERLGFGKAWPSGPSVAQVAQDAAAAAAAAAQAASTYRPANPAQPTPAAGSWGAPADAYTPPYTQATYTQVPPTQPFVDSAYAQAYRDTGYGPSAQNIPPYAPYQPVPPLDPAAFTPAPNRFPAGAAWLIGLGTIFLLTTTGIFNGFPGEALVGCVLLGLGVWIFLHRMMDSGSTLGNDGTPTYPLRLLRALRFSVWLDLLGVLFLLDAFHILTWHYSWPFLIILPGVMALLQNAAYRAAATSWTPPVTPATASTGEPGDSSKGAL
jgi:TM2 domain-containing membrane protein YozV